MVGVKDKDRCGRVTMTSEFELRLAVTLPVSCCLELRLRNSRYVFECDIITAQR